MVCAVGVMFEARNKNIMLGLLDCWFLVPLNVLDCGYVALSLVDGNTGHFNIFIMAGS